LRASRENKSEDSHEGGVLVCDSLRNGHSSRQQHEMLRQNLNIYKKMVEKIEMELLLSCTDLRGDCH
jgi:hypothetical protein